MTWRIRLADIDPEVLGCVVEAIYASSGEDADLPMIVNTGMEMVN